MDRGCVFLSPRWLQMQSGENKGDLIHHGENRLETLHDTFGRNVIKKYLTKVTRGRETCSGPFKRPLSLLNKVHEATSQLSSLPYLMAHA